MRVLLLTCLALAACRSIDAQAPVQARPTNVVLILADDLGWGELGCYGQEKIRTPNLDRLASQGMLFTQCYSGAPVCAPARNVLMTGKHLGHTTIRGNLPAKDAAGKRTEGQHPIPADALTIAEVFQSQGYATGGFGKWGLGPVGSSGDPNAQGFDRFYGYNCQRVAHSYYPPHLWADDEKIVINQTPVPGHAKLPEGDVRFEDWSAENYAPDLILADAMRFLDEHASDPFFLYLPFVEPHVAMQPPREHVESYPEAWDDRPYRGQCGYTPHPRPRAGYAAMITDLDEHVGTVLARLDALGLTDDTLVIFTSDNGTTHRSGGDPVLGVGGVDADFFNSTRDLRGFKGSVYEGGLRVPMIARWPGRIDAGTSTDQPTYFPDLFPTLCEVMDASKPTDLDGITILPTLLGDSGQPPRNPMVWAFVEYSGQVAVRIGNWKIIQRGLRRKKGGPDPWEIYDIAGDRGETTNVAAEHPELIEAAREILLSEMDDNELFPLELSSR
ncbi:MAG: arylsulfatase A [Planctomycetota bacterium]|jgi:arylsulfatase A-like enzyme